MLRYRNTFPLGFVLDSCHGFEVGFEAQQVVLWILFFSLISHVFCSWILSWVESQMLPKWKQLPYIKSRLFLFWGFGVFVKMNTRFG